MDTTLPLNYSLSLARKGAFIPETYRIFSQWNLDQGIRDNLARLRAANPIGAKNYSWLGEVTETMSARFSVGDPIEPLVKLAVGGLPIEIWKYCLLWHIGSTDGLYFTFVTEFLFPRVLDGVAVFTTGDVLPFVRELRERGIAHGGQSEAAIERLSQDLLRVAGQFGFVQGKVRRQTCHPPIPDDALLYAIYSLHDINPSAARIVSSERWKLFLIRPSEAERELLNLHQFRRLRYERAGSVRELALPHANLLEFAQSLVA